MKFIRDMILEKKKWYFFLFSLSFLLYGNTIYNGYTIDDHYVTQNTTVKKGIQAIPEIFTSYYATNENNNYYEYRPLVKVTFAIEHSLFKDSSKASHFINILLYWFALILLYRFIKQVFTFDSLHLSAIIVLFAVLPLHTEVVASLKNRDILLCFLFTLLSFLHLNKSILTNNKLYLLSAYFLAVCAFLSKIEALPFMLIIPLVLIKKHGINLKKHGLQYILFSSGYLTYEFIRFTALDGGGDHHPFYNFERPEELEYDHLFRISVGLNCLGFYIVKFIIPTNMACYYGLYTIPLSFSIYYLTGLLGVVTSIYIFFKLLKKSNPVWIALILFMLPISIYLQVAKPVPGIVADRFTFFASAGFAVIISLLIKYLVEHSIKRNVLSEGAASVVVVGILFIYSIQTVKRNSEWKNNLTLYKADVKKWPNSIKLNVLYANEIIENITKKTGLIKNESIKQHVDLAYSHMKKAYQLDSTYYNILNTMAYIELSFYNQPQRAVNWLYKAQRFDTINYEIPLNMCLAFVRLNKPDSVKKYYAQTIQLNSNIKAKLDQVVKSVY